MSIFQLAQPYFLSRGRVNIEDGPEFDKLESTLKELNIPQQSFLKAVFTRTWGESRYPILMTPKLLNTKWAFYKYADWKRNPDPVEMETRFIARTKSKDLDFESSGYIIVPSVLNDISKNKVAMSYLVTRSEFWNMYSNLDKDIKDEFLDQGHLQKLKTDVFINPKIIKAIKG